MHVLECLEELIDDELLMDLLEDAGANDHVQIYVEMRITCLHVVEHQVEIFVILCFDYIEQSNDVLVAYVLI